MSSAVSLQNVVHRYGDRTAVDGVSLDVAPGEIFALLGPNGSGKTTLFRVLSTLIPLQEGEVQILGCDLRRDPAGVRRRIGVVFQAPSVDKKLSVAENLWHQGRLYGMDRAKLRDRARELLAAVDLADRADDRVETLSGGMRRRVELAKCMLHDPQALLLDEPSTGLDPGARGDLWRLLADLRERRGVTVVLTTHLLEEADKADRLAIMHRGQIAALGAPDELRSSVGGDSITIQSDRPEKLADAVAQKFSLQPTLVDGAVRLELPDAHAWLAKLVEAFPGEIKSLAFGKPTLEDVFIDRTGRRFSTAESPEAE